MGYKEYKFVVGMKENIFSLIQPKQGETGVKLIPNLVSDGEAVNLTGFTAKAVFSKPDRHVSYLDCVIEDPINGILSVILTNQVLAVPGKVDCEIQLTGSGQLIKSWTFSMLVQESVGDAAVKSTNELSVLDQAVADATESLNRAVNLEGEMAQVLTSESVRVSSENTRVSSENTRNSNESTRVSKENTRISSENTRISNETARATSESTRASNENTRVTNENTRISNESARVAKENARNASEGIRISNENTRITNETDRTNNFNAKIQETNDMINEGKLATDYTYKVPLETIPEYDTATGLLKKITKIYSTYTETIEITRASNGLVESIKETLNQNGTMTTFIHSLTYTTIIEDDGKTRAEVGYIRSTKIA